MFSTRANVAFTKIRNGIQRIKIGQLNKRKVIGFNRKNLFKKERQWIIDKDDEFPDIMRVKFGNLAP